MLRTLPRAGRIRGMVMTFRRWCWSSCLLGLFPVAVFAQVVQPLQHAPDGNVFQRLISISIPSVPNAPFTATVKTEWTRRFADGSNSILRNHRVVARDDAGRVFEERRQLVADASIDSPITRIEIRDPVAHVRYFCYPKAKTCWQKEYFSRTSVIADPAGPLPNGMGYRTATNLGENIVNGLEAVGTRTVTTLNAGFAGTDRPITITKEIWYSSSLGVNLRVHRVDPRFGTQDFSVTEIDQAAPDPALFQVPAGYTVVHQSTVTSPAPAQHTR